jgi:hypothetical protein
LKGYGEDEGSDRGVFSFNRQDQAKDVAIGLGAAENRIVFDQTSWELKGCQANRRGENLEFKLVLI